MIRQARLQDAAQIADIYNRYVNETTVTFELDQVSEAAMRERIRMIAAHYPYLVYEQDNRIIGYCYAHGWKDKAAYSRTVETTVYLHPSFKHRGIGSSLMKTLIQACGEAGFHTLIACITEGNGESVALHEKFGFRQVSHFHEVGYKFGRWLGIVDYELTIRETSENEGTPGPR